jgi:hypothetical protein
MDLRTISELPCDLCGRVRTDHVEDMEHAFGLSREDVARLTRTEIRSFVRWSTKVREGEYEPELPSPAERRRIRLAAGFTQEDVGDMLEVSHDLVYRWEKPAGYLGGRRLPGREPTGERRRAYAQLLENMKQITPRD